MSDILNKELEAWYGPKSENGTLPDGFTGRDHATLHALAWKADKGSRIYDKGNQVLADRLCISTREVSTRLRHLKDLGLIEVISKGTSRKKYGAGTQKIVFTLENGRSLLPALGTATVEVHDPNGGSELPERWKSTTETVEADFDPTYNKETNTEPRRKTEAVRPDPSQIIKNVKLARQEIAGAK